MANHVITSSRKFQVLMQDIETCESCVLSVSLLNPSDRDDQGNSMDTKYHVETPCLPTNRTVTNHHTKVPSLSTLFLESTIKLFFLRIRATKDLETLSDPAIRCPIRSNHVTPSLLFPLIAKSKRCRFLCTSR